MLKKMWALFIVVSLVLPIVLVDGMGADPGTLQLGTQANPHIITSVEQFNAFKASATGLQWFKVEGDLTLDRTVSGGRFFALNFECEGEFVERVEFLNIDDTNEKFPLEEVRASAPEGYIFNNGNTYRWFYVDGNPVPGETGFVWLHEGENQVEIVRVIELNGEGTAELPYMVTDIEQLYVMEHEIGPYVVDMGDDIYNEYIKSFRSLDIFRLRFMQGETLVKTSYVAYRAVGNSVWEENVVIKVPTGYKADGGYEEVVLYFVIVGTDNSTPYYEGRPVYKDNDVVQVTQVAGGSGGGGGSKTTPNPGTTPTPSPILISVPLLSPVPDATFTDISQHWGEEYITELAESGIINGYDNGDGTFDFLPENNVTRAEFIKMLVGVEMLLANEELEFYENPDFPDIIPRHWAYAYVEWASLKGYIGGYEDGEFRPNNKITREEIAVILANFKAYSYYARDYYEDDEYASMPAWNDESEISPWARESMKKVQFWGYLDGDDMNYVHPTSAATRAEAAKILLDVLNYPQSGAAGA
ncbi:MAG: S-layer homology domain-containing protein [Clostridiales bacterium]|jgi:hypothetical protein|nr:S-layer homology domain-containing protein [Clostridiales bacterium]